MLVFGAIRTDTAPCGRYIQLPVNLGMPEAWQGSGHTWPSVGEGAPGNGSILEAAAHLGVGVFASAPLQEGQLLQDTSLRVSVSRTTLIRFKPRLQLRLVCVLTAAASCVCLDSTSGGICQAMHARVCVCDSWSAPVVAAQPATYGHTNDQRR